MTDAWWQVPDMQRCDLATVILQVHRRRRRSSRHCPRSCRAQLKALGIEDVLHFDFMSPPPVQLLVLAGLPATCVELLQLRALELLHSVGAIDLDCQLTQPTGVIMVHTATAAAV